MESSTEILCRLLDERGVEYEVYIEQPTGFEHVRWSFGELGSADFNLEFGEPWLTMYGIISGPEQAIAATLGPCNRSCSCTNDERTGERTETCEMEYVSDWMSWYCKSCGQMDMAPRNPKPRYCKWCGRKVVDDD